ncbi:MAG: cell division protein FtsQ [Frankiaceae bacterium]|jgi:cell division protein FtsQ|nr:cell division protein FtsQ [Frankiaceae bacterium]
MREAATLALRSVPRAALALPPAFRRGLAIALVALVALAGLYFAWFRDSGFARVKSVEVSGLSGPQSRAIRESLVSAGLDMTTLHVNPARLRDAVSAYPVVRSVSAQGNFPHALRIQVELNLPVAALQIGGTRVPVASDGLLLRDVPLTPGLPTLTVGGAPPAARVDHGPASTLLRVVAAAPPAIRPRIKSVAPKPGRGLVAQMRRGPDLIFGDASRLAAKWIAAVRVLSSPSARGATYVDLRLPERPAAGGLSTTGVIPLAPAGADPALAAPAAAQAAPTTTSTTPAPSATTAPATTPQSTQTAPAQSPPATQQAPASATTGGGQQAPQ